jgi:hypothetical protein
MVVTHTGLDCYCPNATLDAAGGPTPKLAGQISLSTWDDCQFDCNFFSTTCAAWVWSPPDTCQLLKDAPMLGKKWNT